MSPFLSLLYWSPAEGMLSESGFLLQVNICPRNRKITCPYCHSSFENVILNIGINSLLLCMLASIFSLLF